MRARNVLASLVVVGLVFVFAAGITHLLALRVQRGDVFPPYSSLRADPLGVKAFYESLGGLPGLNVRRNLQPLERLASNPSTTLFFLGSGIGDPDEVELDLVEDLERVAASGSRVVISFIPVNYAKLPETPELPDFMKDSAEEEDEGEGENAAEGETSKQNAETPPPAEKEDGIKAEKNEQDGQKSEEDPEDDDDITLPGEPETVKLLERWGITYAFKALPANEDGSLEAAAAQLQVAGQLPSEVSWHTSLYFDKLDGTWRTLYARDGFAVVVERDYGSGTLVFSADSFLFSNEAMLNERHPAFLAWLVGANTEIVFDETHLGTLETPSIMALARRYRLHGVLACVLALAVLFVWKNAAPFVPPHTAPTMTHRASRGRDAAAGFATLLRRTVPERDLVRVCVEEWRKTFAHAGAAKAKRAAGVEPLIEKQDPVAAYRAVCDVLTERKGKP